jgi:hypothetical protein
MKRVVAIVLFLFATLSVSVVYGQENEEKEKADRDSTSKQLSTLLGEAGPGINVEFKQSQKQPYNYVGSLKTGLVNAQSFEIVISVTSKDTIGFRVYPHYKGAYINTERVADPLSLTRLLLRLSDRAFLFWGADESGDIFTGYTFTLESGFPEEAIKIVLRSIVNSDKFVGEMRPFLDAPIPDIVEELPETPAAKPPAPTTHRGRSTRRRP